MGTGALMRAIVTALLLAALACPAARASEYPEIRSLSRDDLLYVQLQDELEGFYQWTRTREPPPLPPPALFSYRRTAADDLFSLNARLGIPYDTLATLNEMGSVGEIGELRTLLVPTQPGIFVPDPPRTELQSMMLGTRLGSGLTPTRLMVWKGGNRHAFTFFPGSGFSEVERAYFLQILFRFPVVQGPVTSRYGKRANPFTGRSEFHNGIDIGAPEGAAVHAARGGTVEEAAYSDVLGKYVVLTHPGGYQTVYGHLSAVGVTVGEKVSAGSVLGAVGRTGMATGPHLHFEVRRHGESSDPANLLLVKK
jgi:murein DD-endopeptidase MepM/ murein hydrolase activator NlpD